ncbi:pilin N-terminal domain-containing protein [Enterococcus songbeiensis]|uniref:pilin N-terminal domain-containing protein n=1 Tax=Enterococcus songbeiensis TaxID=2559927 RepID=UPI0010F863B2|nr:pilin N-terminal domain-containing protein [Enterococcus songbeiensis]
MKNLKTKIWALLGTLVMLLPFALGLGGMNASAATVEGDPDTVTVNLHKLKFMTEVTDEKKVVNDGSQLDLSKFPGSQPLAGAGFTVYDVSVDYYDKVKTTTPEDIMAEYTLTKPTNAALVNGFDKEEITNDAGLATFDGLPTKTTDGRYAIYLFVETTTPESMKAGAENIMVAMPFYNPNSDTPNEPLTEINLYPKNVMENSSIKIKKVATFAEGAGVPDAQFQIATSDGTKYYTGTATNDIADFGDTAGEKGTLTTDNQGQITVSGLPDGSYNLIEIAASTGFVTPSGEDAKTPFTIVDGKLSEKNGIYHAIDNVDLGFPVGFTISTNYLEKDTIIVENMLKNDTANFTKVDVNNTGKKLPGADFLVIKDKASTDKVHLMKKSETSLLEGEYPYAWSDEVSNLNEEEQKNWSDYVVTSDEKGNIAVKSLKVGSYFLQEIKAPDGYVLPSGEAAFTNFTITPVPDEEQVKVIPEIANQPKGILPSTGGMGIIAFVVAGIVLVGGAVIYFNKRRQETEA